jgi:ketosteroid isomerase-like protein
VSENLDLVRSIYAAWERGDFSSADWAHPEIDFVIAGGPAPGRWTGLTAMADVWREVLSAWDDYSGAADAYRELDGERILVFLHLGGRGKTSGMEVDQLVGTGATLFHIADGKVRRLVVYFDRERALADLGLSE